MRTNTESHRLVCVEFIQLRAFKNVSFVNGLLYTFSRSIAPSKNIGGVFCDKKRGRKKGRKKHDRLGNVNIYCWFKSQGTWLNLVNTSLRFSLWTTYYQQLVCKLALEERKLLFKNIWILRNWTSKQNNEKCKGKKFIHICRLYVGIKHFALINASFQRPANEKDFFFSLYTSPPPVLFIFFLLAILFVSLFLWYPLNGPKIPAV